MTSSSPATCSSTHSDSQGWRRRPSRGAARATARIQKSLRQITDATGGRTEMVERPDQLTGAVDRIADELGRQYSLAYERTGPRDGRRHAIQVDVKSRGARVRARSGYVAD